MNVHHLQLILPSLLPLASLVVACLREASSCCANLYFTPPCPNSKYVKKCLVSAHAFLMSACLHLVQPCFSLSLADNFLGLTC